MYDNKVSMKSLYEESDTDKNYDKRSGKGDVSVVPEEIKYWNWGAFGLNLIWGIYHGVWIWLLLFIPFVNIIVLYFFGLKGNEWAWKAKKYESVEKFNCLQEKWRPLGIIFSVIGCSILLLIILKYLNLTVI